MKYLLARENSEVLAQLAWSNVLVAFDFDGTLAPIVSNRDDARMRHSTCGFLVKICNLYPCAVISGRAQSDVSTRLGGATVKYIVGNHGLEPGSGLDAFEVDIGKARKILGSELAEMAGVELEDKRYSLAVHYRRSRNKRAALAKIVSIVENLPVPMRVVLGKQVVNVIPKRAPNKGDALMELRAAEHADTALYIGDDVTDEDVFELDQPGRLLTIRVGEAATSAATYFVRDQSEVDRLLSKLIRLREKRSGT